jgi:hypothetical protein
VPLTPDQEPEAAKRYLDILSSDAEARQRFADVDSSDSQAVAKELSETLQMDVHPSNLRPMAQHLRENYSDRLDELATTHPACGPVVMTHS